MILCGRLHVVFGGYCAWTLCGLYRPPCGISSLFSGFSPHLQDSNKWLGRRRGRVERGGRSAQTPAVFCPPLAPLPRDLVASLVVSPRPAYRDGPRGGLPHTALLRTWTLVLAAGSDFRSVRWCVLEVEEPLGGRKGVSSWRGVCIGVGALRRARAAVCLQEPQRCRISLWYSCNWRAPLLNLDESDLCIYPYSCVICWPFNKIANYFCISLEEQ